MQVRIRSALAAAAVGLALAATSLAGSRSAPTVHDDTELAANSTTCGSAQHIDAGGYSNYTSANFGVRAKISLDTIRLCKSGTSSSGSSVWVMATAAKDGYTAKTRSLYAQAGYEKLGPQWPYAGPKTLHTFSQWTRKCYPTSCAQGVDPAPTKYGTVAPTNNAMYSVYLNRSTQRILMYVGTKLMDSTDYDPASSGGWDSAWRGEFFGESYDPNSDVVGTSSDPATITQIQRYEQNGSINFISTLTPFAQIARYHASNYSPSVGGLGLKIWTNPL